MKILLVANASYEPPRGGSTRSNLAWLRELIRFGHECRVVCSQVSGGGEDRVEVNGLRIRRVPDLHRHWHAVPEEVEGFQPDWVLVSSEDLGHVLLRAAQRCASGRVVYLAHTPQLFPFGPESWNPDPSAAELVRQARAVVAIGEHMAGYIREHLGGGTHVIHPPIYGALPCPRLGRFGEGSVLMINPCAAKGISIFLAVAERLPEISFLALAGWGTTTEDRAALARLPNVRVLETVAHINEVFTRTRLLLMPSLWYEGFGLIAMEAMLRGIPVLASDSGGLQDAKQGVAAFISVNPIRRYQPVFDEQHLPRPVMEQQCIEPWVDALSRLWFDRQAYEEAAARSSAAGHAFVSSLQPGALGELLVSLASPEKMRILLAHNSLYYPSHGGGDKSNRLLMEALAARGHIVRAVARVERFGEEAHERLRAALAERRVSANSAGPEAIRFTLNGVDVHTLTRSPMLRLYFARQIKEFDPHIIITSTDDPAQLLLDLALDAPRARVVHLIRATVAVPFGPHSARENAERASRLAEVDGVIGVSEAIARYARDFGKLDAIHVPISLMEQAEIPQLGRFENSYVTLVNPCAVKGITIFLGLARALPHLQFAAVPTWGTTAADRAALEAEPNVTILPPCDDVDRIFAQTRVLLVPSVWVEARSRIVVEAMARGIPVLASDIGGIPEAKLGVPYLLPVRPIEHYRAGVDERIVPVADVPEQDLGPWKKALKRITTDRHDWQEIAGRSRQVAIEYISNLSVKPFESYVKSLLHKPKRAAASKRPRWSAEKQRLLVLRMRQAAAAKRNRWFPLLRPVEAGKPRLFCFPYAGAGALAWRGWQEALGKTFVVCPVQLPGRETRSEEQPFVRMADLIKVLTSEIEPLLDSPFVFFGHSMGAGIAFELARALCRYGKPLPRLLVVSGARAPQLRCDVPLPLTDQKLIERMRLLGGLPDHILDNAKLLTHVLPALHADTELYRQYTYTREAPLDIPIVAYGGSDDRNVIPDDVAAWREQTVADFRFAECKGGHFFIHSHEFLKRLEEDLAVCAWTLRQSHPNA